MPLLPILLLLVTITSCLGNQCKEALFQIAEPRVNQFLTTRLETEIEISAYPSHHIVYEFRRRKYYNCCEGGLDLFIDTTCTSDIVTVLPDKDEAVSWVEKGKCKIGIECPPYGDCRGDTARICDDLKADQWVENSSLKWMGSDFKIKLRSVCTCSWECSQERAVLPIILR